MSRSGVLGLVAAVGMGLSLAACGEGSVGSTPAPTPSPTPTPTPTPTPPPTGTNSSLLAPLLSETFSNDATTSSGTFPAATSLTAAPSTLTISYNQTNQTYTILTQDRTQSFAATDRDATQSSAEQTTFKKVNGTTTDLLTLTNPGSSGRYLYTYVGAGFWQRSVQGASTVAGTFDSFTYGVTTPSASVPRSGSASYDFDVLGVLARSSGIAPYGMNGSGTMSVDFAAGQFNATGTAFLVDTTTGSTIEGSALTASGTLGSGNSLTGSFVYDPLGSRYVGGLVGRFYGPAAQEFGAAVYGIPQNQAFPGAMSAALIGRKSAAGSGSNLSLLSLPADQIFPTKGAHFRFYTDPATGKLALVSAEDVSQFTGGGSIGPQINYTAGNTTYAISDSYFFRAGTYGPAQSVTPQPDARYTEYRTVNGTDGTVLKLYKPGATNPELALTYSSFGIWDQSAKPAGDGLNHTDRVYFTYGIAATAFPRTGTASYSGIIRGTAGSTLPGDPYDVTGNFNFNFDFAADNMSGTFSPILTDVLTGAQRSAGVYALTQTRGPQAGGQYFDGFLTLTGATQPTGAFKGGFFGPAINEIAGTWLIREADPAGFAQSFYMTGAFIGKKN
jgi:hypothetical protein